ncbi:MFS transporter [Ovoidimarina sediminis]|uniref:MFS transporter n=1 Tax=Ovoidimarina sediminis TaxID=3079856 RepID=UPI00290999E5|nr:MFS transporter [Rhodophyticola sp. MJ-SS7]MDU8943888.1 MFS transporter [Rhodophyticola sp. MJ-SS7]
MDRHLTRKATLLIMLVFLLQPLAIGGWLALIPVVKANLLLSKGELAIALMAMPMALIPSLQVAGRAITRVGPRRIFRIFFPLQALAVLMPLYAWGLPSLFAALFLLGAMAAFLEVAINVYAGRLEKQAGVMIMNRCHGFWAMGIMAGSALVALLALTPLEALLLLALVSVLGGVTAGFAMPQLGDEGTAKAPPRRRFGHLPRPLIFVAAFMFLVTLTEGVMADWSAVFLAERLNDPYSNAGIAVTVFSGFMAGGRFLGDWLKRLMGGVALARLTTASAALGLLVLIAPLPVWMMLPGFALVGFGISAAYPLGVSAIAALDDAYESSNIAIMATVALGGFLIGPPLIGLLSEAFSLRTGFAALLPGLILALWLTRWLRPGESPR